MKSAKSSVPLVPWTASERFLDWLDSISVSKEHAKNKLKIEEFSEPEERKND